MSTIKKQGVPITYDPQLKITVAREYLTSNLGYGRLAVKYGLPGADTVKFFVKWYKNKYPDGIVGEGDQGEQELSKELKDANLKITALEMLIENASKLLGVDIVKKYGTKQPKK